VPAAPRDMGTGSLCACLIVPRRGTMFAPARKYAMPFADGSEGRIFAGMADILESAPRAHEEPKLVIRKAPHVPVWSVWATLEGTHSEELFEGSTEEEASNWINSGGQAWLEERRRKRNA
jgi:hypothetical protein